MGYDTKLKKVSENAFEVLQFEIEKKKITRLNPQ